MKHPKVVTVLVSAVLAVLVLGATGCEEPGAPKVYRDPANTIYVEVNDEFVIALESNHSTGYSWQLLKGDGDTAFNTDVLELVSTEYEAPDSDLMGAPGEEKWTFKGKGNGRTYLQFVYVRPWETEPEGETEAATEAGSRIGTDHSATATATETGITTEAGEEEEVAEQEAMTFTVDVGPSGATSGDPDEYTYKDGALKDKDDKTVDTVTAELGSEFALLLESNPTTGYGWQLAEPLDESKLLLVSKEFQQSKDKPEGEGEEMVGVGGEDVWTFRAIGEGETEISLKYVRSWEPSSPDDETVTFAVSIEKEAEEK